MANVGGVDVVMGYTQRFYSGRTALNGIPSSNGEINLGLSKDFGFARAHFDLFYNLNAPNSWNGIPAPAVSNDSGAPDGFLMDGAAYGDSGAIFGSQSDILHAGVNLTVKF